MRSTDKDLVAELEALATSLNTAMAKIQSLAADSRHVIWREAAALTSLRTAGPAASAALLTLAERLETANCEAIVFPNARCGIESVVRPAIGGFSVVLRDTDADRTLPTVHRFANRDEAIARAKHLVGVS